MRAQVLIAFVLVGCGDDRLQREPDPSMMMMMNTTPPPAPPPATASGLSGRVFDFPEAEVLGIGSGIELRIGALAGSPEQGPFQIRSLGNSDEASGTLTVEPCSLVVTASSFPGNARLKVGATISLVCAFDAAAGVLRLTDPASAIASEGELCTEGCELDSGN